MNSLWLWLSAAGGDLAPIDTSEVTNSYNFGIKGPTIDGK